MNILLAAIAMCCSVLLWVLAGQNSMDSYEPMDRTEIKVLTFCIIALFAMSASVYFILEEGIKMGQIEALENKWHYEQHIVYKDTIPVDTLYVKIK